VTQISIKALNARYSLLNYYYTLFYKAYTVGLPVARALLFEFPTDPQTYTIDRQFMIGPALLISPVLEPNVTYLRAYFPNTRWYDFWTYGPVNGGGYQVLTNVGLDTIPVCCFLHELVFPSSFSLSSLFV
jgi:alpha-glucosidase (family GH31 glycosyl hydrolase)